MVLDGTNGIQKDRKGRGKSTSFSNTATCVLVEMPDMYGECRKEGETTSRCGSCDKEVCDSCYIENGMLKTTTRKHCEYNGYKAVEVELTKEEPLDICVLCVNKDEVKLNLAPSLKEASQYTLKKSQNLVDEVKETQEKPEEERNKTESSVCCQMQN